MDTSAVALSTLWPELKRLQELNQVLLEQNTALLAQLPGDRAANEIHLTGSPPADIRRLQHDVERKVAAGVIDEQWESLALQQSALQAWEASLVARSVSCFARRSGRTRAWPSSGRTQRRGTSG